MPLPRLLAVVAAAALLRPARPKFIDRATPAENRITKSLSLAKDYALVFSDEFETDGRRFDGNSDLHWQALRKPDDAMGALHYYNDSTDEVTTLDGKLVLRANAKVAQWREWNKHRRKMEDFRRNYTTAMLTSWNRVCFTGGILELSAQLPGGAHDGGLWPAAWLLGNLARPTYPSTTEYVWPWSYDTCDAISEHEQLISACHDDPNSALRPQHALSPSLNPSTSPTKNRGDGLKRKTGRGAPEIDIFEALASWTPDSPPNMTATLTVAPGIAANRPHNGALPNATQDWYDGLEFGAGSELNKEWYGSRSGTARDKHKYWADSISGRHVLGDDEFNGQALFRVEWEPGAEGFVRWYLNSKLVFGVRADSLRNKTGALIPNEPMQIILNIAMNNFWAQPQPCDTATCGACFACLDCKNPDCQCALPPLLKNCAGLPAEMKIDFIRVFQDPGNDQHTLGCSPDYYPTEGYIAANKDLYRDWAPRRRPPLNVFFVVLYWCIFAVVCIFVCAVGGAYAFRSLCSDYDWVPGQQPKSPMRFSRQLSGRLDAFGWFQSSRDRHNSDGPYGALGRCLGFYRSESYTRYSYSHYGAVPEDDDDSPRMDSPGPHLSGTYQGARHSVADERDRYTSFADVMFRSDD
uniref:GH16 domain-containing protein n=1 Tax=Phaeomonas parva TaxID=124430 RepID=A0A7S1Y0E2_9STRA|mmetsp:Transcript_6911/g.20168  ORF Transcript_6911/g.20168 Transcript_6911/m.20168 type:complete len:636 (+) Transcript_6911:336-2243(+)